MPVSCNEAVCACNVTFPVAEATGDRSLPTAHCGWSREPPSSISPAASPGQQPSVRVHVHGYYLDCLQLLHSLAHTRHTTLHKAHLSVVSSPVAISSVVYGVR